MEGSDPYTPSKAHLEQEYKLQSGRRTHTRYPVSGNVYVRRQGSGGDGQWAKLGDISSHGCYLQTSQPLEVGRRATLSVKVAHSEFQATAVVRAVYGKAMGMEFTFLSKTDRRTLQRLIAHLREFDLVLR
jgi:hypothetical protein